MAVPGPQPRVRRVDGGAAGKPDAPRLVDPMRPGHGAPGSVRGGTGHVSGWRAKLLVHRLRPVECPDWRPWRRIASCPRRTDLRRSPDPWSIWQTAVLLGTAGPPPRLQGG